MHTLEELAGVVGQLSPRDKSFAEDLITKGKKYGLSPKQAYWVDKLFLRTQGQDEPPKAQLSGNLAPMMAMLQFAAGHLKAPKVRLLTEDAVKALQAQHNGGEHVDREWLNKHTIRLSVAGPRSRYQGKVTVADAFAFGYNTWYGAIDSKTGEWQQPRKELPLLPQVTKAVEHFSKDPIQAATAYGKLMGYCCFCNLPLTDKRSVKVGYGKTCASHYGLPWGGK